MYVTVLCFCIEGMELENDNTDDISPPALNMKSEATEV